MGENHKQALSLSWVYGLSNVPANIVNLSDGHKGRVAYAAAHTAVIYDKHSGAQAFLQGHCCAITALQATPDRSLLVTADAGPKASLLVLWDPDTGQPITTVQQPHGAGVLSIAISADGQQLATLSAPAQDGGGSSDESKQEISVWDISSVSSSCSCGDLQPTSTTAVPTGDTQTCVSFHAADAAELMTNGSKHVFFWQQQPGQQHMTAYSPPFRPAEFQLSVGDFVASVFVPGTSQALTSTVDGDVVIWEREGLSAVATQHSTNAAPGRRALKIIRLHGAAINHLSSIGDFIITGSADGLVRLFDSGMRLCAWFEDINAGAVTAVSFATKGQQAPAASMHLSTLSLPDFMVSTVTGKVLAVSSESFNTPDPGNPSGSELLVETPGASLSHVVAHPLRPELLLLSSPGSSPSNDTGKYASTGDQSKPGHSTRQQPVEQGQMRAAPQQLLRWDLVSRSAVVSRELPQEQYVVQLAFSRDGAFAVLGCAMGHVVVLKGDSLQETVCLRHTKHEITRLSVASDGRFVASSDSSGQVLLYGFLPHKGAYYKWDLVGKFTAHHKEVMGLHFGEAPGGQTRLFSLGADQRLIEYDLASCTTANTGLKALRIRDCVPPGSIVSPCAMCFAPPMPYYSHSSTVTLLLVADDAYKIKAYNPDAATSLATATYLGPTFGDPINKLLPFRSVSDSGSTPWLAYSTAECVVGLIKWPLGCDPQSSMGLIAHPGPIQGLVLSFDGRKLITLGTGGIMNVWEVNTAALLPQSDQPAAVTAAASSSCSKLDWAQLVGDAALYEELRDYFCYAQLTTQPLDTTGSFDITGHVPVTALPDLMRAAGHYPSEAETTSLLAHVSFLAEMAPADDAVVCSTSSIADNHQDAASGSQPAQHNAGASVDLDTFMLLYLSHRPVLDFSRQQMEAAFKALGATTAAGVLSTRQLLEMLQTGGEPMSSEELQEVLQTLTGADSPEETLPEWMDAHMFMTDVLGLSG